MIRALAALALGATCGALLAPAAPPCPEATARRRAVDDARAELVAAQVAAAAEPGLGTPVEEPPDLPDAYRPAALQAYLEGKITDDGALLDLDCDEYPCLATVLWTGDAAADADHAFREANAATYPHAWATSAFLSAGGTDVAVQIIAFPAAPLATPRLHDRVEEKLDTHRDEGTQALLERVAAQRGGYLKRWSPQ